ncbi:MAG: hypothetical protein JSU04_20255 [Bdellovibrionales bacterium]|nr:hypothetical protein [Bdellovibrionales bacterium]
MSLVFKSKLLREQIKHWVLVVSLSIWAFSVSVIALTKSEKVILIGIDDAGARIITENKDRLIQSELKNFLKAFFDSYYVYDEKNFLHKIGSATEIMTDDLWQRNKDRLLDLHQKLQNTPLSQTMEIESIDLVEPGKVEAILGINIHSRMNQQKVRLKVNLEFKKNDRNEKNPWGFEVTELSDAVI